MYNAKQIAEKISDHLAASGWQQALRMFLDSAAMEDMVQQLIDSSQQKGKWVPDMVTALRWMTECPYHDIRVIILTDVKQNMYGKHMGIPLSGKTSDKAHPILEKMLWTIDDTIRADNDTTRWSRQGVLQMSMSPTYTIEGSGHHEIWKPLIAHIIAKINEDHVEAPVILISNNVSSMKSRFKSKHVIQTKVGYRTLEPSDVFIRMNEIIANQGKKPIKWI